MAAEQETPPQDQGGTWSRIGLQLALIAVLGLAALSFVTLGLLQQRDQLKVKPITVTSVFSGKITQPPPSGPEARPGTSPAVQPAKREPGPPSPSAEPAPKPVPSEVPVKEPDKPPEGGESKTAPPAPEVKEPAGSLEVSPPPASTTPIPLNAAFKPPPDRADKEKQPEVPQPAWQTVEKDWGKVKTETAPESVDLWPGESPWTQLAVGQTAKKKVDETKTAAPAPVIKKEPKPGPAQVPAAGPKVTARPEPPPAKAAAKPVLTVAIINESGRPEVAEAYRDVLQARGYRVEKIENRTSKTGPTTIFYAQGFRGNALDLARGIPGQRTLAPMIDKSAQNFVIVVRSPLQGVSP